MQKRCSPIIDRVLFALSLNYLFVVDLSSQTIVFIEMLGYIFSQTLTPHVHLDNYELRHSKHSITILFY